MNPEYSPFFSLKTMKFWWTNICLCKRGGVGQMFMLAYEGGGGVKNRQNLVYVIYEQPQILNQNYIKMIIEFWTKWQLWPKNFISQILKKFKKLYNFISTLVVKMRMRIWRIVSKLFIRKSYKVIRKETKILSKRNIYMKKKQEIYFPTPLM